MFEGKGGGDGCWETRAGVWTVVETGRSNVTCTSLPKAAIACLHSQTTVSKTMNLVVDSDWRSGSASCGEYSRWSWASRCTLPHDVNAAQASDACLINDNERPCPHWTCLLPSSDCNESSCWKHSET